MLKNLMDTLNAAYVRAYLWVVEVDYKFTGGYVAANYM